MQLDICFNVWARSKGAVLLSMVLALAQALIKPGSLDRSLV
jgi:hypothetical protein